MTYTQLTESYWRAENRDRNPLVESLPPARRAAWKVLKNLCGRGGFDDLIGSIDDEDMDELFEEMVSAIEEATR